MRGLLVIVAILLAGLPAAGAERAWLGKARIYNNDFLGDGKDRWRTFSYSFSYLRGTQWNGSLPTGFGELVEYRLRTEIIAPDDLTNPAIGTDRRFVSALHLGAFSHMALGKADLVLGVDLVMTGPQTGIGALQSWVHEHIGIGKTQVFGSQIGNAVYPTLNAEIGREFRLSPASERRIALRPFLEAQAGVETFVRFGADLTIGQAGLGDLLVRDTTTGQRSVALKGVRERGTTLIFGGDVAYVNSSKYLPAASGFSLVRPRVRLRAGLYSEWQNSSFFYGLTWLGKEFANQQSGQMIGSVTFRRNF